MTKKEDNKIKEPLQTTTSISVKYPDSLIEEINKYQLKNHLNSRSAAILELVRKGLGIWE